MTEAIRLTLPDGSVREVAPGTTPLEVAAAIGPRPRKSRERGMVGASGLEPLTSTV